MVLAEYAKRMVVLFEAEGYRRPTIAKMLESKSIGSGKVFTTSESRRFERDKKWHIIILPRVLTYSTYAVYIV